MSALPAYPTGGAAALPQAYVPGGTTLAAGYERIGDSPGGWYVRTPSGRIDEIVWPGARINAVADSDYQVTLAADDSPLRLIYGRVRLGARLACLTHYGGDLIALCLWGEGLIGAVRDVRVNNIAIDPAQAVTHYLGTHSQTADPTLVAAFAALAEPSVYADALPDVAYSVLHLPAGTTALDITAECDGLVLYDPRTTAWAWSDNPALVLADVLSNTRYGAAAAIDWASVATVADACDALVGPPAERRRTIGLVVDSEQPLENWIAALATYAGCWVVDTGAAIKLVADRPVAAGAEISHAAGEIQRLSNLRQRGLATSPTVMEVRYTDTSVIPWREASAWAMRDGVAAGTVPRRPSTVSMPGIQRHSQATREAVERLNKLTRGGLSCETDLFDAALSLEVGDIRPLTHPLGLAQRPMRCTSTQGALGRYRATWVEYDAAVYDDSVVDAPAAPSTGLPDPLSIPVPAGLALTEERFVGADGRYTSRIAARWDAVSYQWLDHYRVELRSAESLLSVAAAPTGEWRSGPIQAPAAYTVAVSVVSTLAGAVGTPAEARIDAQGKLLPPSDVAAWTTAREVGGKVYLAWTQVEDIDAVSYELRYSATNGSWAAATRIDRVDALSKVVELMPEGTWRFYVAAVDSVGNFSANPISTDIAVTRDPSSYTLQPHVFTSPTLTAMSAYTWAGSTAWVTDHGNMISYGHSNTNDATGYFTDLASTPFADPHTAAISKWVSESYDMVGASVSGEWVVAADVTDIAGTHATYIELSPDGSAWTAHSGTRVRATGRFVRVRFETATGGTMRVRSGVSIALAVTPRRESGTVTTSASGATTVSLAGKYLAKNAIVLAPQGTVPRNAAWDNVILSQSGANSFDVYCFQSGVQIAASVGWTFEGI